MKIKTKSLQFKVLLLMSIALAIALAVSVLALTRVYGSIQELDRISRDDFETQQSILRATDRAQAAGPGLEGRPAARP